MMDKDKLKELVFNQPVPLEQRRFKLWNSHMQYDSDGFQMNHDPNECEVCAGYVKLFQDEALKHIEKFIANLPQPTSEEVLKGQSGYHISEDGEIKTIK